MSVAFMLGRSGSGKTTLIWERIAAELKREPLGPPILQLVPEQGSFQAERGLLAHAGLKGGVRVHTLGFSRLAHRVKLETGGSGAVPITDEGKKMLIYNIIRRRKDELKLFGASADRPGFVERLSRLHTEMKRCCLGSEDVQGQFEQLRSDAENSPILMNKLEDLGVVFAELEREMSQLYMDEEDRLGELAANIPDSDLIRNAEIWVDGFHGFTPQEFTVLRQLMLHAAKVTISLTLDGRYAGGIQPGELDMFHPAATSYAKLRGMAEEIGADAEEEIIAPDPPPRFSASPGLRHLERGFERRLVWSGPAPGDAGITLHAAASRRAEAEGALREMIRLAREEGARYGEMAVLVRNLEDYAELFETLSRDYGVPCFIDRKVGELHHPLAEFIRSSLDVIRRRWRYEDVFRCVKTDLLLPEDGSLNRADMDTLENYVLACGIQGYRWTDGRSWRGIPSLSLEGERVTDPELMNRIERCREAVVLPLQAFEKRVKRSKTGQDLCAAVFRLLEETGAAGKLEEWSRSAQQEGRAGAAREHRQLWGAVLDLLDQIHEMMGREAMDFDLFAGVLETGLAELRLGLVPPSLDQVLVGSMDRTRTADVKYAFVLGVNEGVVPALPQEDGILSDPEREMLERSGMELAPDSSRRMLDERFLVYNALTAASRRLWISYSLTDAEGRPMLPSEVIRQVRRMFPFLKERPLAALPLPGEPVEEQAEFVSGPADTLRLLVVQLRRWRQGEDIPALWWDVYNWFASDPEWKPRLERLLRSLFYRNRGVKLRRETSMRLYGGRTLRGSVSRMERFVSCPFSHFASYGLRLKERQLYRLQAPDIGQLFHAALSEMALRLKNEGRGWGSLSPEECRREADATVDRLSPMLQGEILMSSKRYGYITRKLKNIVGRASVILGEHARRGSFEPIGLELDFGPGKELPPLRLTLPNGCVMEVVGRIDRVDMAEGENGVLLRVIDYKSSQKDLKLHEVYYGLALQMLTYLDVLLTYAEEWIGRPALPAGTLYFHVHEPLLSAANGMDRSQAEQELLKRFKMKGLLLADKEAVGLMDTGLDKGHSSIVPAAIKSDGSFYSSSSVATPEQWNRLLTSVRSTIKDIGTRITEGDVEITPYRIQQETACTFCAFRPVCQFDEAVEGNGYHLLGKPGKEQIWDLLSRGEGGQPS